MNNNIGSGSEITSQILEVAGNGSAGITKLNMYKAFLNYE
jgi:hypothetical protein